jgi:uncharacterized protein (UPF0218 family)
LLTVTTYVLPQKLRGLLSRPLGDLVAGSQLDVGQVLRRNTQDSKPPKVILVGDTVSRKAIEARIVPDLMIIDNLEKRSRATPQDYAANRVIRAKNRAGMIEEGARVAVERAVRGEAELVEIEGEEDLLTLVAVLAAPAGSLVIYGQPNEGVVVVRVALDSKARAQMILDQMERVD